MPKAPPASIDISTHTWECLLVNWTAIPTPEARGVIIKYHIYYKLASGGGELYQSTTSNSSYQLCGLLPYTEYEVKISGFTSKGEGTPSEYSSPVRTGEYSKFIFIITKFFLYIYTGRAAESFSRSGAKLWNEAPCEPTEQKICRSHPLDWL